MWALKECRNEGTTVHKTCGLPFVVLCIDWASGLTNLEVKIKAHNRYADLARPLSV